MNNLKKIKLVHETPNHFIMHDGNSHFHVAKKGLDQEMVQKIQGFADGGEADSVLSNLGDKITKAFEKKPTPTVVAPEESLEEKNAKIRARAHQDFMGYADGGQVSFDDDFAQKFKKGSGFSEGGEISKEDDEDVNLSPDEYKYDKIPRVDSVDSRQQKTYNMSSGGKVPDHNINPKEMEEETKHLNTPEEYPAEFRNKLGSVQHFDVGGTAAGLPPDFDNRVEAEKQNLAVNATAMPPQTIDNNNPLPMTASPLPTSSFQSQAETNVASQDLGQMSKAMQSEETQKALTAQAVQDQNAKIMSDNIVRSQAGLPTLPLTPEPSMEQSQMPSIVPRENQVSFSSQGTQVPQDPRAGTNLTGNFDKAMGQIQGGINKSAQLQSQAMAENAKNTQAYLDDQKQRAAQYEKERADIQAQNTELFNQVRDSKIDPNRIWNNSSTGQKISSALGLIFGGLGAGMSHQPSQAADFLEKTIQNDIEAQKSDQSNKTNLYKLGLEKYRDSRSAEQFASLQASNVLAAQIQQTAQKIGSPQALAMAQQAIGELHLKYDPIRNDLALKQVALNYGGQQQGQQQAKTGVNTGKLNAFLNAGLYDEDTKKALIKEQGDYMKAKNYSDLTDDLFNTQTKNANYTNRGMLQHLPTMRDSTKEYDSKVNSFLDKITKDLTGRVTPQSMENLRSSMPVAGDSPAVTLAKRQAIKDIIKTGYEYPTLINKGLLNPNDPYITSTGNMASKFTQGAPVLKK